MAYKLLWEHRAQDDLKRLEKSIATRIIGKVTGHLAKDPLNLATALKGALAGLHRYRVGDYRVIIAIDLADRLIMVLRVAHRKNVYEK